MSHDAAMIARGLCPDTGEPHRVCGCATCTRCREPAEVARLNARLSQLDREAGHGPRGVYDAVVNRDMKPRWSAARGVYFVDIMERST